MALATSLLCVTVAADEGMGPVQLRRLIDSQVGGIDKLMVPANDADLPQPRLADGSLDPFFQNTEAKRYLGKSLFHDPARMVRVRPQYGGVLATAGTASCGTCHLGEFASKAGTLLNFALGGEGRGYTDEKGNFIARRRPRTDLLPQLRTTPLFPGDALVDSLPTLTDIWLSEGKTIVGTPAPPCWPRAGSMPWTALDATRPVRSARPSTTACCSSDSPASHTPHPAASIRSTIRRRRTSGCC
jgi:hypothetical protein